MTTFRQARWSALLPLALSSVVACGGDRLPPRTLVDARAEYARAKQAPTIELNPTGVHEADLALQRAERAWEDDPEASVTSDLAVIAQRKAQIAQTDALTLRAEQEAAQAKQEADAITEHQLKAARGQLDKTQQALSASQSALNASQSALEAQRAANAELAKKLADARDTISKIAAVKDDDRGMVITLSGEVLFKTKEYQLKPAAMAKLDQIAEALHGKEQPIVVFGYTDNVGTYESNLTLSTQRATSVRDYLVARGIPQDLIKAEGKGPENPVAENTSIEGRAANRRVEIVVKPKGT